MINDIGLDIDGCLNDLEKHKQKEKKTNERMDEYEEQIFELRSKLETKLFESLPDVRVGHDIEQLSNSQFGNPY